MKRQGLFSSDKSGTPQSPSPNELIAEIYSKGYVKDQEGQPTRTLMRSAIPHDQGMALYHWIRKKELTQTLEIGMAYGLSTLFICQAHADNAKGGHHVAIDPKQSALFHSIGLLNTQRANLDHFLEFFEAPSYDILPRLRQQEKHFDLIFIDGMHTFDFTLVDFFYADLLLKVGGYMILDDIWMPSVRKVLTYVLRNRKYQVVPTMLDHPPSLAKRAWQFARTETGRLHRVKMNVRQWLQNPFDVLSFYHLGYFGVRGGLKFWGLEKLADDNRPWDYHVAF